MTRRRSLVGLSVFAAAAVAQLVAVPPASAHTHPTPTERAAPAVVYVETRGRVDISLIEHNRLGRHIGLVQRTYSPILASGSGFAVDPAGVVVTSGAIITPNLQPAEVYAVNQLFHDRYGNAAPLPADPFAQQTIPDQPDDNIGSRLTACYVPNTTNDDGGCVVKVTPEYRVFPYVTSQPKFGALSADVLVPASGTADVAVLRVGASSMPTVALGQSVAGAEALSVLGFTAVPGSAHPMIQFDAHLVQKGATTIRPADFTPKLLAGLRDGMRGAPVVAEAGQVIGLLSSPLHGSGQVGTGTPTLITVAAIRASLQKVQVTPHRGPVDVEFEAAMHNFKNGGFAASVPSFEGALSLYPGHYLASINLATAKSKVGSGSGTVTPSTSAGSAASASATRSNVLVWLLLGLALVAAIGLTLFLLRRRRGPPKQSSGGALPGAAKRPPPQPANTGKPRSEPVKGTASPGHGERTTPSGPTPSVRDLTSTANDQSSRTIARPSALASASAASGGGTATRQGPAPAPSFCTSCGGRLAAHHRFCGWCGEPVVEVRT